ncbi:MAG: hypothetical protein ACKVX7_09045 [Planctomycetota bacterium]
MSFANLSPALVLGGFLALGAILFVLQRLRVRYRRVPIVTTLFWRQAIEESRARVLTRRFRHLLAYLLILSCASLLWLALARPLSVDDGAEAVVVLFDASAGMAWGDRHERACALLEAELAATPRAQREVFACGERTRQVLARGEHERLLRARRDALAPNAAPCTLEATIDDLLAARDESRALRLIVFASRPLDAARYLAPPADVTIDARVVPATEAALANVGITAIGATNAVSGAWDRTDVLIELRAVGIDTAPDPRCTLDGEPLAFLAAPSRPNDSTWRFLLRDLPALGGVLEVQLVGGDALALDDIAQLVLPKRSPIRVALSPTLEPLFAPVFAADPAILLTQSDAQVAVRRVGESFAEPTLPAFEIATLAMQPHAIKIEHEPEVDSDAILRTAVRTFELDGLDATIPLSAAPGRMRRLAIWESLIDPEADWIGTPAFPVFVALAMRWLANSAECPEWFNAGEPLRDFRARFATATDVVLDPVGDDFTAPRAGRYRDARGTTLAASLRDVWATTPPRVAAEPSTPPLTRSAPPLARSWQELQIDTLLLAAALALLIVEWWLYQTGRIP